MSSRRHSSPASNSLDYWQICFDEDVDIFTTPVTTLGGESGGRNPKTPPERKLSQPEQYEHDRKSLKEDRKSSGLQDSDMLHLRKDSTTKPKGGFHEILLQGASDSFEWSMSDDKVYLNGDANGVVSGRYKKGKRKTYIEMPHATEMNVVEEASFSDTDPILPSTRVAGTTPGGRFGYLKLCLDKKRYIPVIIVCVIVVIILCGIYALAMWGFISLINSPG